VACVDIKNKKIRKTRGLHFPQWITEIADIDNDNKNEIFTRAWAPNNCDSALPYPDTKAWFTVFNDTLGFQYPPIGLPSRYGSCNSMAIGRPGHYTILADYGYGNGLGRSLLAYDTVTHKLKKTQFQNNVQNAVLLRSGKKIQLLIHTNKNKYYLLTSPESIRQIHLDYDIEAQEDSHVETNFRGKNTFLFSSAQPKGLLLLNSHFKKLAFLPLTSARFAYAGYHSWRLRNGKKVQLLINTETQPLLFNIKKNPYYYTWPLVYLAVFGFFLGLVLLISFSQKQRIKKKQELENKMLRLQLITLKGQMRPHFIFNALNSIMANINLGQQEIAYKYLGKFSRLLRMLYSEEEKLSVSLKRELEFVENYLELEHLRYKEEFSFEINVDKNVDTSVQIPRMLIQIFVENGIKHGIRQTRNPGFIQIKAYSEKSQLIIEVEDNGIGRQAASQIKRPYLNSGYGLKVVNDMIAMHKRQTGIQLKYRYVDLYTPEGKAAGTRVVIEVLTKHK
jgi:two-component sensor histidine kinase